MSQDNLVITLDLRPLVNALDSGTTFNMDTGQDRKSQKDAGLRVLLGLLTQTVYTQTYGKIPGDIPNAKDRCDDSLHRINKLYDKWRQEDGNPDFDAIVTDPGYLRTLEWQAVNEARLNVQHDYYSQLRHAYKEITGVEWEPREMRTQTTTTSTNKMTDDLKAKAIADAKARFEANKPAEIVSAADVKARRKRAA